MSSASAKELLHRETSSERAPPCSATARLLCSYAKRGMLAAAQRLLEALPDRDVVTWTSLIAGYVRHGRSHEALRCYECMRIEGLLPNQVTFSCLLNASRGTGDLGTGRRIHDEILRSGLSSPLLENALVDMYAKHGALATAQALLDQLLVRSNVSWNAVISGYSESGELRRALACLSRMQVECLPPDSVSFACILKACGRRRAIDEGERVRKEIIVRDLLTKSSLLLGTALLDMYAKCGMLEKAREVINDLPVRDVVSWSALIVGYTQAGRGHEALECFEQMQREGVSPDAVSFICALKACAETGAVGKGRQFHKEIKESGLLERDINLGGSVVEMYAKCGMLSKAREVFDSLPTRNVSSWSSLIVGFARDGRHHDVLWCLNGMRSEGIFPDAVALLCILRSCSDLGSVDRAKEIHVEIACRFGLSEQERALGNALVDMYAKHGLLGKAQEVFDELLVRDVVAWSALIAGYGQQGEGGEALKWFQCMGFEGVAPNEVTFTSILQVCGRNGDFIKGEQIHEEIVARGLSKKDAKIGNALVDMYARCGKMAISRQVLEELPTRNRDSWNALIGGYAEEGEGHEALECIRLMHREGIPPNQVTLACILRVCGDAGDLKDGKQIHTIIVHEGWLEGNVVLGNVLVEMYAKCGALMEARAVLLLELPYVRDAVTWSLLVPGYMARGQAHEALVCVLEDMRSDGVSPNDLTFTAVLDACSNMQAIEKGRQLHVELTLRGSIDRANIVVATALIGMYAKCGELAEARMVSDGLPFRDLVCWNALICSYAERGEARRVFSSLSAMQRDDGLMPDAVTFMSVLRACGTAGAIGNAEQIHREILNKRFLEKHPRLGNALVDMYAKLGMLRKAQAVLESLPCRDAMSWGALIAGYAKQGRAHQALDALMQMQMEGVAPNEVAFLSVMHAFSCSGRSQEAAILFEEMITQYGIVPTVEHYTCMMATFGSGGNFEKAISIAKTMMGCPDRDPLVGLVLLCACRKWGNMDVAKLSFNEALPHNSCVIK